MELTGDTTARHIPHGIAQVSRLIEIRIFFLNLSLRSKLAVMFLWGRENVRGGIYFFEKLVINNWYRYQFWVGVSKCLDSSKVELVLGGLVL